VKDFSKKNLLYGWTVNHIKDILAWMRYVLYHLEVA
jgi:hypothetical protein